MEHTTIICTAYTLSMPRYARALPASAANANPAMLETSAQSMRTAATARESQPLSRCSRIGFARSADAITVESRSAPKQIFSQGRPAEKGWPDPLRGIVGRATTAPPRWLWIIGMGSIRYRGVPRAEKRRARRLARSQALRAHRAPDDARATRTQCPPEG